MNYANEQGVQIYYVSDREQSQLKATIKNLTAEGLPQAEREHILLKQKQAKTKEQRRQQVAQQADVIMLFGDDLSDFNDQLKILSLIAQMMLCKMRHNLGINISFYLIQCMVIGKRHYTTTITNKVIPRRVGYVNHI